MDEILIEEKRYVSSKQAAKVTGYAKDYIGQLCREGRVPARLVGRSWYVLETAITDHRFGKGGKDEKQKNKAKPIFTSTWETPRYETLKAEASSPIDSRIAEKEQDISERLQDSWREWFSQIGDSKSTVEEETEKGEGSPEQENESEDTEEVPVAIRAVHHHPLPAELPPRVLKDYRTESSISEARVESKYVEEHSRVGR